MAARTGVSERTIPGDDAGTRRRARASPAAGFWIVTGAFAVVMSLGTLPGALWPLYQSRDGFSNTIITLVFAAQAVGMAIALSLFGHLSDRFGRRRVIGPALLMGVAACGVMAIWSTLTGLMIGRLLTGISIGMMVSTATAYLIDLHRLAHPDQPTSTMPGLVSTAANLGGLAIGPFLAGVLAQWAPAPLITPFLAVGGLMLLGWLLLSVTPETVNRTQPHETQPARVALQPEERATFIAALVVGFLAFAVFGVFSSLGSIIIRGELGVTVPILWGVGASIVYAASALGQLALARLPVRRLLTWGVLTFPVGLVLVLIAMYRPMLWLYILGAGVAGAGVGLLVKGSVTTAAAVAAPASRAGVLALYFIVVYTGLCLPPILLAGMIGQMGPKTAVLVFGAVLTVSAAAAVRMALARPTDKI